MIFGQHKADCLEIVSLKTSGNFSHFKFCTYMLDHLKDGRLLVTNYKEFLSKLTFLHNFLSLNQPRVRQPQSCDQQSEFKRQSGVDFQWALNYSTVYDRRRARANEV